MSDNDDWQRRNDRVMPQVCRPARPNPPLPRPGARPGEQDKRAAPEGYHQQRWAQYERYGQEPAPAPEKTAVVLRIGLFFDGTGNNASNTAMGQACGAHHAIRPADIDASCAPYMSDPDSSYGNDLTNVAKLYELYGEYAPPTEDSSRPTQRKLYIDGIGTRSGQPDSRLGAASGRGQTGIEERVNQVFSRIRLVLDDVMAATPDGEIVALVFDLFGFSRGATAARHCANELLRGRHGGLGDALHSRARAFGRAFVGQYGQDISVGVIGLFDTVVSVAGVYNLARFDSPRAPGLKLYLDPGHFPQVLHLVARDEYRSNFPLRQVSPDHSEITLPGAHSNIGGGYRAEVEERVLVSPMRALTVSIGTDVRDTSIYREADQARTRWLAQGWPAAMLEVVTPSASVLAVDPQDRLAPRQKRVYAGLQLRRPVSDGLSRVYLRVMYAWARQKGVRLDTLDQHDPAYRVPQELQPLGDRFAAGDYSLTPVEERMLTLRYIHRSAHWNHPLGKHHRSLKVLYINAPTADSQRIKHPHVPDWAIQ